MVTKIFDRIVPKKVISEEEEKSVEILSSLDRPSEFGNDDDYKLEIVWRNVFIFIYLHAASLYGFTLPKQTSSVIMGWVTGFMVAFGTTVGAHRLFTHRSYKANTRLRLLLVFMQTMAVQNSMYEWVRDHRVHHKYTDTNADPHNSKRGFFFSHIGWLMCKKHPDVKKFGGRIDMSDLDADPIVMFQHKYYLPLAILFGFVAPIWLACYFGELFFIAWHGHLFRYLLGLHLVWMINSAAHLWGYKPYDAEMSSTDSIIIGTIGVGEGWHNYHHVFPYDYKASELPSYWSNLSLAFLDFFAWIGWATDLKTVSDELIKKRALRTGDGTHKSADSMKSKVDSNNNHDEGHSGLWGWDDKEMTDEDRKCVKILYKVFD